MFKEKNINNRSQQELSNLQEKLEQLKSWLKTQPDLKNKTDGELIWFLKKECYDVEKAENLIFIKQKFENLRPKIFKNRDPSNPEIKAVWDTVYLTKMPFRLKCETVLYIGLKNKNPSSFDLANTEKLFYMNLDMLVQNGDLDADNTLILDGKGVTSKHFSWHNLPQMKLAIDHAAKGNPVTIKSIYVVNTTPTIQEIYFIAKPFIPQQVIEKLTFINDYNHLPRFISTEILPYELGGSYGPLDQIQELMKCSLEKSSYRFDRESQENKESMDMKPRKRSSFTKPGNLRKQSDNEPLKYKRNRMSIK